MSTPPTGEDPTPPSSDDSPTLPPTMPRGPHGAGQPEEGRPQGAGPGSGPEEQPLVQQHAYAPPGSGPQAYGQPGYGQPGTPGQGPASGQWGQQVAPGWWAGVPPQPLPRDRTRTLLITALVAVGLAIAACIALLVYVLSSTVLDRAAVESAVAAQFEEREGVALDLECGRRMIVRPGADYECEGTTADGEEIEILIIITDDRGRYSWTED